MNIDKETLWDLVDFTIGKTYEGFQLVQKEHVDSRRWEATYEVIIKHVESGRFYAYSYNVGLTECQDCTWWEDEDDLVKLQEVFEKEKVITYYE